MQVKILPAVSAVLAALLIFCFTSCNKVLNQEPVNSTYDGVFWKSVGDCNAALAGNYSLLRDALTYKSNSYYMYGDAVAQNYFTIQYTGDALEYIQGGDFTQNYNLNSLGNWSRFYKVIAMCNTIIKKVPAIDDKLLYKDISDVAAFKDKIVGQAFFIRAYCYFMLTRVWGEAPIELEAYDNPLTAPQLERSSRVAVMKQVEDDCHKAIAMLSWGYENTAEQAVMANKGSAYALLAHLYLWRATMTDATSNAPIMQDVQHADTTIDAVLTYGGYNFTDTANYSRMFIGRSSESIFEINMSEDNKEGSFEGIGLFFLPTQYLATATTNPRYYVPKRYLDDHYGFGGEWVWDEDAYAWIWNTFYDSTDVRFRHNFTNIRQPHPVCLKYSNVVYRSAQTKTDPYLSNNMILFRLSDMVLLKAEIALYKGDAATAAGIINDLRKRRGANEEHIADPSGTVEDVMYEYVLERGKELYLEGHVYWDLLRTRQYEPFIGWLTESRFKQSGYYWPVDPTLFRDNLKLSQTSYWKGKI
ncbi:SusD family protein [Filimonas lacunae]|uniref:SusD family protein n=1 Tax=Filimonas lacunae TaxID=477680 RepID=A0A173ME14_9BACT|nr:RagB/SusD family nutrient uptake outer membrane protein [Filimonas lacunae]BAV05736.1 outer membrane protein, nutrient binding [Filimonas lacunae]SIT28755.1 SusD family protein [Filimonas lacunae]